MKALLAALALTAAACSQSDVAAHADPTQELTGRVVDHANLLDAEAEQALVNRLEALEAKTTDQVVVVTVNSLQGQPIEKRSLELANGWGIGQADVDNGVLMLVAPNERQVRIEVGLGLEGLLTNEKATEIIKTMIPRFREGQIQEGIVTGVSAMETLLMNDQRRPQPQPMKKAA